MNVMADIEARWLNEQERIKMERMLAKRESFNRLRELSDIRWRARTISDQTWEQLRALLDYVEKEELDGMA